MVTIALYIYIMFSDHRNIFLRVLFHMFLYLYKCTNNGAKKRENISVMFYKMTVVRDLRGKTNEWDTTSGLRLTLRRFWQIYCLNSLLTCFRGLTTLRTKVVVCFVIQPPRSYAQLWHFFTECCFAKRAMYS